MEAVPKVHRHRHRRSNSRRHQEQQRNNSSSNNSEMAAETTTTTATTTTAAASRATTRRNQEQSTTERAINIIAAEEGMAGSSSPPAAALVAAVEAAAASTRLTQQNERQNSDETTECSAPTQQTVVLVNGHSVSEQQQQHEDQHALQQSEAACDAVASAASNNKETLDTEAIKRAESPQPTANGSSRNSSGDAMSLRETLQQLQPTAATGTMSGVHHHHHQRRRTSPSPARRSRVDEPDATTSYFHRGIIGFMDREIKSTNSSTLATPSPTPSTAGAGATKKLQSLSDPQASPAQRSTRSRSSLEKSPRRKRSKSESRRRRERKLIAAGEMEVRQANETLMRYLKQCTDINDASLSGELEIDQNLDERRVHRKTKSQRDKRGHLISKLYTAGGLTSILKELSDDIVPADGEEIYNPFTPVVSPTDDAPAHIDKMFIQTSSGYRPVDHCYYKHSFVGATRSSGGGGSGMGGSGEAGGSGGAGAHVHRSGSRGSLVGMRGSASYSDTRCLLDAQCRSTEISSNLHLACVVQRIWLLVSNICHGLLAGLALAHLLFVITSHPLDWSKIINDISLAGEAAVHQQQQQQQLESVASSMPSVGYDALADSVVRSAELPLHGAQSLVVIADYAAFAEVYANTFYCLAIVCLVSIFDRMDICHLDLSNATELVSFRWIIIAMIYIATIILSICSNSIDEKLYFNNTANVTLTQQELLGNQVLNVWNSLSVARSLGAIFGWIMIGLTPHDDMLYEHLLDMARYETNN